MDTASLIGALGSIDVMSVKPVLLGLQDLISGLFTTVTGSIEAGVDVSAGIAGFIQGILGSSAGGI